MKYITIVFFVSLTLLLSSCAQSYNYPEPFSSLSQEEFKQHLNSGKFMPIDIRTSEEVKETGKINPNAIVLDFTEESFIYHLNTLPRDKAYLLYCAKGGRSSQALEIMKEYGFSQVNDLKDGCSSW